MNFNNTSGLHPGGLDGKNHGLVPIMLAKQGGGTMGYQLPSSTNFNAEEPRVDVGYVVDAGWRNCIAC